VNSPHARFSLSDPRDLNFALRALLGFSRDDAPETVAAKLPPSPTVAELVDAVFADRSSSPGFASDRETATSLLAAYFAIDPPVDPDPRP